MSEQQVHAALVQQRRAPVFGIRGEREPPRRPLPLPAEVQERRVERHGGRLEQVRDGPMAGVAEGQRDRERLAAGDVHLHRDGDVSVVGRLVLPVHHEVVVEVRPPVVHRDVPARAPQHRRRGAERHPRAALVCHDDRAAFRIQRLGVVVPPANLEVWRAENVRLQRPQHVGGGFDCRPHEDAVVMGRADERLVNAIQTVLGDVDDVETQRDVVQTGNR